MVFTAIQYKPLEFQGWAYTPEFTAVGWLVVAFCVSFVPVVALIQICYRGGFEVIISGWLEAYKMLFIALHVCTAHTESPACLYSAHKEPCISVQRTKTNNL